jgi:hypothetical protein
LFPARCANPSAHPDRLDSGGLFGTLFAGEVARAVALSTGKATHLVWQYFSSRFAFFKYWLR